MIEGTAEQWPVSAAIDPDGQEGSAMYNEILVPVDGSIAGQRGLDEALALAKQLGSRLVLLHVVEDFPITLELAPVSSFDDSRAALVEAGRAILDKAASQATAAGVPHIKLLNEQTATRAADAIVEQARQKECRLIVMGTHGRRGVNRLVMGSDAVNVLRAAPVPVLFVRVQE
ncbi:MAG TPA: universal stress protein [Roseateles sp.]